MPETLSCLFAIVLEPEQVKADKFDFCGTCINRELDPFECEDCEDGDNYEPIEEDSVENLTYHEFIEEYFKEVA